MISTRQLVHFLAVMECGSFLGASRKTHISQPALGKSIGSLESYYGVDLFKRLPRGVEPTVFALALKPYAERMVRDLQRSRSDISGIADGSTGVIKIGVGSSFIGVIGDAIEELERMIGNVQFTVLTDHARNMRRALLENRVDFYLGMANFELEEPEFDVDLFFSDQFVGVCAPGHPFAGRIVTAAELARSEWVVSDIGEPVREAVDAYYVANLNRSPDIRIETNSDVLTRNIVLRNNYISLAPKTNFLLEEYNELNFFFISKFKFHRRVGIVKRANTTYTPIYTKFIDIVAPRLRMLGVQEEARLKSAGASR